MFYVSLMHETIRNGKRHFFIYISPEEEEEEERKKEEEVREAEICVKFWDVKYFLLFLRK